MKIVVCMKYAPGRVSVDPLTGAVDADARSFGPPLSDQAALELALSLQPTELVVVCVGPPAADKMLREVISVGATRAVRFDALSSAADAAAALATVSADADLVLCGDGGWSGSGSVPAFIAAQLGRPQILGAVRVVLDDQMLTVERRVDRGRIAVYTAGLPAVVSVEGSVAKLRRASLPGLMAAQQAQVEQHGFAGHSALITASRPRPLRQRTKVVPPPSGGAPLDRILAITKAKAASSPPRTLRLPPEEAAAEAVASLRIWGYL